MSEKYVQAFCDYLDIFKSLDDSQFGRMMRCALIYKTEPQDFDFAGDAVLSAMWQVIKAQLDREHDAYLRKVANAKASAAKRNYNNRKQSQKSQSEQDNYNTKDEDEDEDKETTAKAVDNFVNKKKLPTECVFCQCTLVGGVMDKRLLKCPMCGAVYRNGRWKQGLSP